MGSIMSVGISPHSTWSKLSILELMMVVSHVKGLKMITSQFNSQDDLVAKVSGWTLAIVFGVISEKIKITKVRIIEPSKTFPPK